MTTDWLSYGCTCSSNTESFLNNGFSQDLNRLFRHWTQYMCVSTQSLHGFLFKVFSQGWCLYGLCIALWLKCNWRAVGSGGLMETKYIGFFQGIICQMSCVFFGGGGLTVWYHEAFPSLHVAQWDNQPGSHNLSGASGCGLNWLVMLSVTVNLPGRPEHSPLNKHQIEWEIVSNRMVEYREAVWAWHCLFRFTVRLACIWHQTSLKQGDGEMKWHTSFKSRVLCVW